MGPLVEYLHDQQVIGRDVGQVPYSKGHFFGETGCGWDRDVLGRVGSQGSVVTLSIRGKGFRGHVEPGDSAGGISPYDQDDRGCWGSGKVRGDLDLAIEFPVHVKHELPHELVDVGTGYHIREAVAGERSEPGIL